MKALLYRFLLFSLVVFLVSCDNNVSSNSNNKYKLILPKITVISGTLPLYLNKCDFTQNKKVSKEITDKIENVILDFYFNYCNGDSTETYFSIRDVYFNTIEFSSKDLTFYLVILNRTGGGGIQSRLICYDHSIKMFYRDILNYNLASLYNFDHENQSLIKSNLNQLFDLQAPEIEKIASLDNSDIFRFNELCHNGTSNALESTVIKFNKSSVIDTIDSEQIWIGPYTGNE